MIAKKIFYWKCFTDWRVEIENLFPEILSPRIRAKVSECPDKIQYVDDQTYIYSLIKELQIQFPIPDEFARRFANNYSHIRTYHLCRPMDISTYQDKGLLVLSAGEIQALFKSLFLNSDYPELTQKDIDSAISEVGTKTRDGVLYLGLDDRFLMEYRF